MTSGYLKKIRKNVSDRIQEQQEERHAKQMRYLVCAGTAGVALFLICTCIYIFGHAYAAYLLGRFGG